MAPEPASDVIRVLAARIHDWGAEPELEEIAEPTPGTGESLVALEAATVSHLDLDIAAGALQVKPALPYVPGTDGAGRIIRSPRLRTGAPVRVRGGGVGLVRDGCWAERVAVPDDALHPLPENLDPVLGASFFVPCTTAYAAVHEVGALAPGERVAVTGAGGAVGSVAVQLALAGGAAEVVGLVGRVESLASVPFGAVATVIDDEALAALAAARSIDLLIDTVGGEGLPRLVAAMRPCGRIALVGYTAGKVAPFDLLDIVAQDVRLLPVNQLRRQERMGHVADEMLSRLASGDLTLATTTFRLSQVLEAIGSLRNRRVVGRIVIVPND